MTYRYRHGDRPLEGYTIRRGIGRGGFGEVYYAISDGGREVALKVVQQNHDIELRGINHCINLKNPHLVSIFDVKSNQEGAPFVIMEYVAGPSLRDLLRESPEGLGVQKAVFLVREIAKGLSYLHDRGIVHRDLKPENIFYEDGYVKIGDYGLSKYISVSRQSGQTISVGTVHYMAPEIGSGNYSHGIDVYALGIILYELLSGNVPFDGDSMGEILMKHLTCEPDLSAVDEMFRPIIAKALEKRPEDRYGSVRDMVDALMQAEGVARKVADFNPASLTVVPTHVPPKHPRPDLRPAAPTVPQRPAAPRLAGPPRQRTVPPPLPSTPPTLPQQAGVAAADVPATGRPTRDVEQRVAHAVVTVLAMAFAVTLFTGDKTGLWTNCMVIAGLAGVICFVECWWVPRIQLDPGLGRRLLTFGVGIPVLLLAQAIFGLHERFLYVLMAGLVFIDWTERTKRSRVERVSFGLAFSAALFGLIASAFGGIHPLGGAGLLAAVSLTVGALAPFGATSRRRSGRRHAGRARPQGAGQKAAMPVAAARANAAPPVPKARSVEPEEPLPVGRSTLALSQTDAMLGGVCGGIARRYDWEVVWLRAAFLLAALLGVGAGIVIYIVLWICMPAESNLRKKTARTVPYSKPGIAQILLGIFLLAVAGVLIPMGFVAAFLDEFPPFRGSPVGHFLGGALFFGLAALSLVWGLLCLRRRRTVNQLAETSRGWKALGALFLMLALVPVAVGTVRLLTFGTEVDQWVAEAHLPAVDQFVAGGGHLALGFILFLPGLFFVLLGRRDGGAGHVLRGAVGWTLVGALVFLLAVSAPRILNSPNGAQLSANGGLFAERSPGVALWSGLFTVVGIGVVGAVVLAWPRSRHTETGGTFVLEDGGGEEAAESANAATSENTV